ncbi:NPP1 family protein [Streptomyces roseirectus]|uniref:NPP1 family protein n=1 Tax=Streptomyces roseirectus TaxID=2768066 RepID=A0A7H0I6M5_9ACTN|nr:NPP1 family protein [Streptomyces roseirectus]QNP68441.1 NPP1 family protein [Streptomyces roseirectus]
MSSPKSPSRRRRWLAVTAAAGALVLAVPTAAYAAPPKALPQNAEAAELTFLPAFDYDTDGCYSTPAIGPDGTINGGLNPTGPLSGECHDASDLDNTNSYSRSKCNNGWCAYMYGLYFEKDQALANSSIGGHRNDWEHVVIWVRNGAVEYVATSNHGSFTISPASSVRFDGTHAKVVYHKDGISTHCFRLAGANDEPPENDKHTWQYPPLVGWNGYPAGLRDKLSAYDFGSANFGLKDGNFVNHLTKAKPSGIAFDPAA